MKKIIITNKFKGHMVTHEKEFIVPFEILIKKFEKDNKFQGLKNDFCKVTFDFGQVVGINTVVSIEAIEKVIYAKRIGRYDAILIPDSKGNKSKSRLCIMTVEDIMWYLFNTSKVCEDNIKQI